MKYIKTFENSTQPQLDDYVVAYRPYRVEKDTYLEPIKIDLIDYILEIGQIVHKRNRDGVIRLKPEQTPYYTVEFLTSGTKYVRTPEHILFSSPILKDAEEHLWAILNSNKFNI